MSDPHNQWDLCGYSIEQIASPEFTGGDINTFKLITLLRTVQHESRSSWPSRYTEVEWLALTSEAERIVKLILATREHVPNKAERTILRKQKMYEKQNR